MKVEIGQKENRPGWRIEIDGLDIANRITAFSVVVDDPGAPRLLLDAEPELVRLAFEVSPADVDLTERFRAALIAFGWTPPEGG